jgi:hypothetical protein
MRKSGKRRYHPMSAALGVAILAASILVILFTGAPGMTQIDIEQHLKQFSTDIGSEAAGSGREAKFNWGNITIEGWGYNKHGMVDDVSFELAEKSLLDTTRWTLSTAKMHVYPDPSMLRRLIFVFSEPVNVIENGQLKSIMTFSSPLKYVYYDGLLHKVHVIEHAVHLPEQITLTPAKTIDAASKDVPGNVMITYDKDPVWKFKSMPDSGERESEYLFRNMKIASQDGTQATIASISGGFKEKPGDDKRPLGNYKLAVIDLALRDSDKSTKSYSLSADINYTGNLPDMKQGRLVAATGDTELTLNQVQLTTDDFKVKASGTISMVNEDPLPSGKLDIDIDNVQKLVASELIPASSRRVVASALQKITGQPFESLTNVTIPLKREKNGLLYVGTVTFEELAAATFSDMLKNAPASEAAPMPAPSPETAVPEPDNAAPDVVPVQPPAAAPDEKKDEPVKGAM